MDTVEARIEIPMGSRNKYEIDPHTGHIKLDRVLYSSVYYPAEYGFVEETKYLDGDPLDILVFTSSPTFPGCYVDCRIIGGMDMIDGGKPDVKILAVNIGDPRYEHIHPHRRPRLPGIRRLGELPGNAGGRLPPGQRGGTEAETPRL